MMDYLKLFRDATMAYKSEALELQRQLRHLQAQYDMLSGQASSLVQGRRARVAATSSVNGQLTTIDDSLSARNLEVYHNKFKVCLENLFDLRRSNFLCIKAK